MVQAFWASPRPRPGEVYNLGGGKANAASLLECVELIADASGGRRPNLTFSDQPRVGDHICYYSDMARFRADHPGWRDRARPPVDRRRDGETVGSQLGDAVRLLLLNQFYPPDISPTAQVAASLAEHRAAAGDEVTVVAGRAGYLEGLDPGGRDARLACVPPCLGPGVRQAARTGGGLADYVDSCACAPVRMLTAAPPGRCRGDDDDAAVPRRRRHGPPGAAPPEPRRAVEHGLLPRCRRAYGTIRPGGAASRAPRAPEPVALPPPRPRGLPRRGDARAAPSQYAGAPHHPR